MTINTRLPIGKYAPIHGFVNKSEPEILRYSILPRATAIACELYLVFRTQIFHKTRAQLRFLG